MDDDTQAATALAAAIVAALPPRPAPSLASALATINVKNHIPFASNLIHPTTPLGVNSSKLSSASLVPHPTSMAPRRPKIPMPPSWQMIAPSTP